MADVPSSTEKKRHYCSVCSNFRGKIVNGEPIILHKFPADVKLRKKWIRRTKTVMKNFHFNVNSRMCSEHFVNGRMTPQNNVPSLFHIKSKKKLFATSSMSDPVHVPDDTELFTTTREEEVNNPCDDLPQDDMECVIGTPGTDVVDIETTMFKSSLSQPLVSLFFHDYCGELDYEQLPKNLDQCNETVQLQMTNDNIVEKKDTTTQTRKRTVSTLTQTESSSMLTNSVSKVDVGIQCKLPDITFEDICMMDSDVMFYTGLPNAGTFHALFDEMDDAASETARSGTGLKNGRPRQLRIVDEFFLVLMRLRLGLLVGDIAGRFHVSKSTCSVIINEWIGYLHVELSCLLTWPTQSVIETTMPNKFRTTYPKTRVIIDCTELFTETPQSLINKSLMYSHYKSHMTYKALLGISPSGLITFVSDLWAGSISDKQITRSCGIINLCERGDAIMADKGFLIADLTTPCGISLIIPPFKLKRFTRREVEETRRIANLRIYVEMAMERVKNFRILQGTIPITMAGQLSKIWKLCAKLSNLQPPLILDD